MVGIEIQLFVNVYMILITFYILFTSDDDQNDYTKYNNFILNALKISVGITKS